MLKSLACAFIAATLPFAICKEEETNLKYVDKTFSQWSYAGHHRLDTLEFECCKNLSNVDDIATLHSLRKVKFVICPSLGDNYFPVTTLPKLTTLILSNVNLTNIDPIQGMTHLTELNLTYNRHITSIRVLSSLNLKKITLDCMDNLIDIDALSNIKTLENVSLSMVFLDEKSPTWANRNLFFLLHLKNLTHLDISENRAIQDVSALRHIKNLSWLKIRSCHNNPIKGLDDLSKFIVVVQ